MSDFLKYKLDTFSLVIGIFHVALEILYSGNEHCRFGLVRL